MRLVQFWIVLLKLHLETSSRTMEKEMKSYGLCSLKGGRWVLSLLSHSLCAGPCMILIDVTKRQLGYVPDHANRAEL